MTYHEDIINGCPNAVEMNRQKTWLTKEEVNMCVPSNKKFKVSFICGGKNGNQRYNTRIAVWNRQYEIKIPKKMYYSTRYLGGLKKYAGTYPLPKETKFPAFQDSMFHIVVENSRINGYFSEKLNDCLISYTVPIYYGCPNIDKFFDVRGIIIAESVDEIINIVNNLTEEDYYSRKEAMEINKQICIEKYPKNEVESFKIHLEPILKEKGFM